MKYLFSVLTVISLFFAAPTGTTALSIDPNKLETHKYSTNNQTDEWITYHSQELGYEFQYPSNWVLEVGTSTGYPYVTLRDPVPQTLLPASLEIGQGAFIEISAEKYTAVVPVDEYVRNNVRPVFGENGELLNVITEAGTSTAWGVEGYYFIHRRGSLVQQNHAGLLPYSESSMLLQIMLTVLDSTQANDYANTYNKIVESLVVSKTTHFPEPQTGTTEEFGNNVLDSASLTGGATQADSYSSTHYLTLPFFSHTDMKVQQGWVSSFDADHYGIDYIKGEFDDSDTWQSFDVLAAADGEACVNCTSRQGNAVWIKHIVNNKPFYTYYGHLETYDSSIPVGSQANTITVKRGQKIGTAGYTGSQVGWTHLHFHSYVNVDDALAITDPYDINPDPTKSQSETRSPYYPNSTYTSMGPNHLFTSDPPSYFGGGTDSSEGGGHTVDVVEIIDSSGSMSWNDPNGQRRNAAKTFVDTSIEGDFVGVVDFDSFARLASPLVRLPENRQSLFSAIDTIDESGGTNLGVGLQAGCDTLINSASSNARKGAIFLTDGQGSYNGQADCYSSRGWSIYAFGLDDADDTLLTDIATSTGGEYKRLAATNLACEFQRVRNKISGIGASPCQSVYIHPHQFIFYLLRVLSGQAQITMSTSWGGSDVEMSLTSPSGRIIDRNTIAEDVIHDVSGTHEVFTIINPEPGEWKVALFGADVPVSGEEVVFGFTSIPQEEQNQPTFADVPADHWARTFIETLYRAGITEGCTTNPLQYCPNVSVSRAQMAVFLERGIHGPAYAPPDVGGSTGFGDVPASYWAAAFIKQLAADGITSGCGSGNYCPESPVTRAQMAVFLLRSKYGASYTPPDIGAGTGFGDVPASYWAAAFIKQLVAEGITVGCGGGNYCPESPVTRDQMAVFLVRTFSLP
jgi:murein DD-endopeptidase MepM/ murein hydrolase activator NlpD